MIHDLDLFGVFVPALAAWMTAAFAMALVLQKCLARLGLYRAVWHRPLFDLALYVVLLGGVVSLIQASTSCGPGFPTSAPPCLSPKPGPDR